MAATSEATHDAHICYLSAYLQAEIHSIHQLALPLQLLIQCLLPCCQVLPLTLSSSNVADQLLLSLHKYAAWLHVSCSCKIVNQQSELML